MKNFLSEIVFSSKEQSRQISQQLKAGLLRKIAPKIYTTTLQGEASEIIYRNRYQIASFRGSSFFSKNLNLEIYFQMQLSVIVVLLKVMLNVVERFF